MMMMSPLVVLATLAAAGAAPSGPLEPRDVPPEVFLDRSGFPELVIHNSLVGPIAGLAVTQALFPGDDQQLRAISGLPLGLAAGILVPIGVTWGKPVNSSAVALVNFGERWGLLNGLFVPALWGSNEQQQYWASTAVLFGVGLGSALVLEPRLELTPGQVSAMGTGQIFGMVAGGLLLMSFDVVPEGRAAFAAPILLFGNAGAAFAFLGRDSFDIDRRRIILMDLGGVLGLVTGASVGFLVTGGADSWRQKPQIYGISMLSGLVLGMGAAYFFTSSSDDYKQGVDLGLLPPGPMVLPGRDGPAVGLSLLQGRW